MHHNTTSTIKKANILIIGDIMIDHYIYGNCTRISPEAPVPVVEIINESYTLGGAGNVVKNIKALNCEADIVTVTGRDDNAAIIIEHLAALGVNQHGLVADASRCTTIKSRVLATNHQLIRLDREVTEAVNDTTVAALLKVVNQNISKYDIVLLSDYNKGLLTPLLLKGIFDICRAVGVKTIVDPKGNDFSKYKGVNIIKPNKKEAIIASGIVIKNNETLMAACAKIKQITGCDDVIITMSEDGMAYYSGNEVDIIPTKALDVADVTGAGDTVLASLGVALASGYTLHNACDFANHAAAVVVNKVGSATATLQEINEKSVTK